MSARIEVDVDAIYNYIYLVMWIKGNCGDKNFDQKDDIYYKYW